MKKQYLLTRLESTTRHSMLTGHSRIRGGWTWPAGRGVRPKRANLSTVRPETFPQATVCRIRVTVGMLITHSFVLRSAWKEKLRLLTTQPIRGGVNSIIVCHDIGMTLGRPLRAVVRRTTGPGSR